MLPLQYQWLKYEGAPRMLVEALKLYGTIETPGAGNTPVIIQWADEVGGNVEDVYKADSIPWCGLFAAIVAKRAEKELPNSPLWALSWSTFGKYIPLPMLGDVLVFVRAGGGHVGLYVGEDSIAYHVLGGNQNDKVTISRILKTRLYTSRRPIYKIGQPPNIRKIILQPSGTISNIES